MDRDTAMKRKWKVWNPEEGDEEEAIVVEHFSPEWAAEEAAEKLDDASAHELFDLSKPTEPSVLLMVRGDDGVLRAFRVGCELERSYNAHEA
jgi:hypothetical protein